MRDAVTPGAPRLRKRRLLTAGLVELVGLAILLYALFGDPGNANATASLLGFGAVWMIFGSALLAPTLVRPLSAVAGKPLRGLTGHRATENPRRQPQRT